MLGALLLCIPLHYGTKLLGLRSQWPARTLGWLARAAGMRVRVIGSPAPAPALYCANHLSWLDILIIGGAGGAAFVSKDDVARWPVVGWLASLNDTVFIARTERRAAGQQAEALRKALARDRPVALFPEGTTDGGREVLPFRASLFAAVLPPFKGLKVQPVALDYGPAAGELEWVGRESTPANARKVLSRPGRVDVTVHFLDPLDPADFPDRKAIAEAARASILRALGAFAPGGDPL